MTTDTNAEPSAEPTADVAVLREAAQQMRQRAEHATGHNWNSDHGDLVYTVDTDAPAPVAVVISAKPADVVHTAGWGPATALAVADWLDAEASVHEMCAAADIAVRAHTGSEFAVNALESTLPQAVAVARAYLDSGWDGDPYRR